VVGAKVAGVELVDKADCVVGLEVTELEPAGVEGSEVNVVETETGLLLVKSAWAVAIEERAIDDDEHGVVTVALTVVYTNVIVVDVVLLDEYPVPDTEELLYDTDQ
jgi:hypothetical protein